MDLNNINNISVSNITAKKQENVSIKGEKKAQDGQESAKKQCSSKTAMALRGMVLGMALAAGVAGAKALPVQASTPIADNNTTTSQEAVENVEKTDVEMMVENAMNEDKQELSSIYVGRSSMKVDCSGEMTNSERAYEKAEVSSDGTLVFYDETSNSVLVPTTIVVNGHPSTSFRTQTSYQYEEMNSFNLGANVENGSIQLQPGARFEETTAKNGDYVELAEDGKTFNVYDSTGKQIGSIEYMSTEEHAEAKKFSAIMLGTSVLMGAGVVAIKEGIDKITTKEVNGKSGDGTVSASY